jgi:hypothetical protein
MMSFDGLYTPIAFLVDSLDKVIIQSDIPVDNNNKILEDENTTKDQNFG